MTLLQFGDAGYGDELLSGLLVTVSLAVLGFVLSLLAGIGWGALALSASRLSRTVWRIYASIVMGVPSILIVFLIYFNLPIAVRSVLGLNVEVTPFLAGVIGLAIVYSAYVGEIFRGAVINVPRGLSEAGRALGLRTAPNWWLIILPQVLRLALPGLSNIWLILLKDTALVSLVGLKDLTRMAYVASGVTKLPFLFFTIAGLCFVGFSLVTMIVSGRIEHRLNRGHELHEGKRWSST